MDKSLPIKLHIVKPPQDTYELREQFLAECDNFSKITSKLRYSKMNVYGMNWMKRGWDGIFQNLDRKFGIIEENLWNKLILKRIALSDNELVYLIDGLIDLSNYCQMALFFTKFVYLEQWEKLEQKMKQRMETPIE